MEFKATSAGNISFLWHNKDQAHRLAFLIFFTCTNLVKKAIYAMVEGDCDEVVLETEITNKSALKLYENLGFVRDKRLFRYYLNGVDALRLKLWLR
ncbi:N-alpha-acetyltransferase 30, NatC catalytic subunit-like protein [Cricetulus griseus]|nr:N-alpha-acetyltransferase 30, NatC catalytic subunit-like protein [Cricetulus griseus]